MTCTEDTNETPDSYQWFKGGVKQVLITKEIAIGNVKSADGDYECRVQTPSGTSVKSDKKNVIFLCEYYNYDSAISLQYKFKRKCIFATIDEYSCIFMYIHVF